MSDYSDRAFMITAVIENYKCGEYGELRTKCMLVLCGLNATEIEEHLAPHRSSAFQK